MSPPQWASRMLIARLIPPRQGLEDSLLKELNGLREQTRRYWPRRMLTSKPDGRETLLPMRYLIKGKGEGKPEGNTNGQSDGDRRVDITLTDSLQEVYHLTSKWFRMRTENGEEEIFKGAISENFPEFVSKFPNRKDKTSTQHNVKMTKAPHQSTPSWNIRDKERSLVLPQRRWDPGQRTDVEAIGLPSSHFGRWIWWKNLFEILGESVSHFSIHNISKFDNCAYLAT